MKNFLLIIVSMLSVSALAQVETKHFPKGNMQNEISKYRVFNKKITKMPPFDLKTILEDDEKTANLNSPYRFGKAFNVSYSLDNGIWANVENGRLWSMTFSSENALSLNFVFENFYLPDGAKLYIENQEKTVLYGPVTSQDIPKNGFFLTDIIEGSQATIYLFEPSIHKNCSSLTIRRVVHGFNNNLFYDAQKKTNRSASCHTDVVCEPTFLEESNAVAVVVLSNGTHLCSGSLQMSTDLSFKPYFLTAFHCADTSPQNQYLSDNEISNAEAWMFKFLYKKTTCGGSNYSEITYNSATFRAGYPNSDFLLMEINHNLASNPNLTWLGWDKGGSTPSSSVSIHHPAGDLMKIAISDNPATTSSFGYDNNSWKIRWNDDGGVTEGGSSGAPLLNQNKRVVGQVWGKLLEDFYESNEPCGRKNTHFGKFNLSWSGGGHSYDRLSDWLDPIGQNCNTTNTSHPITISGSHLISSSRLFSVENLPSGYTVEWSISDNYYSQHCLQQNYPEPNQCTITRAPYQNMMNATLTANIKYNGVTIRTLTKTGLYAYNDFYGEYTCDTIAGIIDYTHVFYVRPGYSTFISSPNLVNATVSYDPAGTTPLYLFLEPTQWRLSFTMPINNGGVPVILNVDDVCGNHYKLYAMPRGSFYFNIAYGDGYINITLENDDVKALKTMATEQPWSYEIRSASMGTLKASKSINGRSTTISTAGWPKGIYIIKAKIGKEEVTEKIVVK